MVSPMAMAYSTPAWTLTFSKVLATSQGHLVSSLSQSQSKMAARGRVMPVHWRATLQQRRGASRIPMMVLHRRATLLKRRGASQVPDTRLPGRGPPALMPGMRPIATTMRRGVERVMPGMRQNMMMKTMFFLSLMRLLE
jgi:hypothetical protein